MAQDHNHVSLVGRMGRDIEVRYLPDGKPVGNFSLAVNGYKKEEVNWIRCVIFGKGAEILGTYTVKGSQLLVSGRLQVRVWEKDGQKRESVEVVVNDFQFLGSKNERNERQEAPPLPDDGSIPF